MMGLPGRSSWAALVGVAVIGGMVGCSDDSSTADLRPGGPPEVLQVFMESRADNGGVEQLLAFGSHPDATIGDAVPVDTAVVANQRALIVVDELLRGNTLEQFKCACWGGNPI